MSDILTIEEMQTIAEKRGGKCLSETYINLSVKLKWQCVVGHEWKATPHNVKNRNSWCPYCKSSFNEERCRKCLEILFDAEFVRCRPEFLMFRNGACLELDCFNEELKIALEYNGIQHYELMHFNKDEAVLKYFKEKDAFKVKKCQETGITLLVIHYKDIKNKPDDMVKKHIIDMLEDEKIEIKQENIDKLNNADISTAIATNPRAKERTEKVKDILKQNDARLVDETRYIESTACKFDVLCVIGHVFKTTYDNIVRKPMRWCPKHKSKKDEVAYVNKFNILYKEYLFINTLDKFGNVSYICKICNDNVDEKYSKIPLHKCFVSNNISLNVESDYVLMFKYDNASGGDISKNNAPNNVARKNKGELAKESIDDYYIIKQEIIDISKINGKPEKAIAEARNKFIEKLNEQGADVMSTWVHKKHPIVIKCHAEGHTYLIIPDNVSKYACRICERNKRIKGCSAEFKNNDELKAHEANAHDIDGVVWFPCNYKGCSEKFKRKGNLESHKAYKHYELKKIYECTSCGDLFKSQKNLDGHIFRRHTAPEDIKWFPCPECDKKFKTSRELTSHKTRKHITIPQGVN